MRFALMSTLSDPKHRLPHDGLLDTLRGQVVLADEMGFETIWLGEHHFGPHGMGNIPNPILVGADLAARTTRIRIGQLANIAVWWHRLGSDRKSTRLNSSHLGISYAVFCLKKKNKAGMTTTY